MPKKNILNPITGNFDTIFDQTAAEVPNTPAGNVAATDVQAAINELDAEKQALSEKGAANGYAPLDGNADVPIANLPDAVLGGPRFQGTWDADTNTPDLSALSPAQGDYYRVSVAGNTNLDGITDWGVGDWAIYNGTAWDKIDNSESVTSVNGQTGTVSLTTTEIPEGANEYHTTDRARTAAVVNSLAGSETDQAPSVQAVNSALAGLNEFDDNVFRIQDNADNSKKLAFEVSQIATSTTRTITLGDRNVDLQEFIISTDETAESLVDYLGFPPGTTTSVIQGESVVLGGTALGLQVFGSSDTSDSGGSAGAGLIAGSYDGTSGGALAGSSYVIGGAVTNLSSTALAGFVTIAGGNHSGAVSGDGGNIFIESGTSANARSGGIDITTTSSPESGRVLLSTGAGTSGDSGNIELLVGTATATQGDIKFLKSGIAPSIGDVWTASATDGSGYWAAPSSSGANTNLSNLASPTSVNQALIPDSNLARDLGNSSANWNSLYTGSIQRTSGNMNIDAVSGALLLGATGNIQLTSTSFNINLVTSGGNIRFTNSTPNSVGDVWTATDTAGAGYWAAPSSSGANTSLSNLTSLTSVNQALIPDSNLTRDLGSSSNNWNSLYAGSIQRTSGNMNIDAVSGALLLGATGNIQLTSSSFNINLVTSGGNIRFTNSTANSVGDVWTATDTAGAGYWAPLAATLPSWKKYTISHTALQTAALTNDIELFSLPAFGVINAVVIKHSTAFAGTGITAYNVSVGITSALDKYASSFDVFQATGNSVGQSSNVVDFENIGAATSIRIAATSVGANLDQSSTGSVDVYVLWGAME